MTNAGVRRVRIGHLSIDRVTFAEALDDITEMVERRRGGTVFTPNVDHVVRAQTDIRFRRAYATVDLALADGMPVVWASHVLGFPVPEKISGSDLVPPLMKLAETKGWGVHLLGGAAGVGERAALNLRRIHPDLRIVGTASPRIDLREPPERRCHVVAEIRRTAPDVVLVALGAPKQELWIHEASDALRPAVLLGVGASIDFLAGRVRRAPAWMSAAGLEWVYRLAREPRRMWRRYLVQDPKFLGIVLDDLWRTHCGGRGEAHP